MRMMTLPFAGFLAGLLCLGLAGCGQNANQVRHYVWPEASYEPRGTYPRAAVFLKEVESGRVGYALPNELGKQTTALLLRKNGNEALEIADPFQADALNPNILWRGPREQRDDNTGDFRALTTLLSTQKIQIEGIETLQITGLKAKGLTLVSP